MQDWEKAINRFLASWRDRDDVVGALVTGSYAAGLASKYSDLDVYIALSDDVPWRERGNRRVDGFLVEYFANPVRVLRQYLKDDYQKGSKMHARMYVIGKIVFDKTGDLSKLKADAQKALRRKLAKPGKTWIEVAKFLLWDGLENLKDLHHQEAATFHLAAELHVQLVMNTYAKFLQAETPSPGKLHRFLGDAGFRRRYKIEPLPDRVFVQKLESCLEKASLKRLERLTAHVLAKMGGFEIDGWKLRTPANGEWEPHLEAITGARAKSQGAMEPGKLAGTN